MVLRGLLVILVVLSEEVHEMVCLMGQRYSPDDFLCLGDFFHHGVRDHTSGFCVFVAWILVFVEFCS